MRILYTTTALTLTFGLLSATPGFVAQGQHEGQSQAKQQHATQGQQQGQAAKQQRAGQSQAQQAGQQQMQRQSLAAIDTNNDGRISPDEARQHRQRTFSQLDQNNDGKLSNQELAGQMAVRPGFVVVQRMVPVAVVQDSADLRREMFGKMDKNQNQQIARQEYMSYGEQAYRQAQQQGGGEVGGQAYQEMAGWRGMDTGWVDQNQNQKISEDEAAAHWQRTFSQLDQNANDQLSQQEWSRAQDELQRINERFAKLDANGDGQITQNEFVQAGQQEYETADVNADDKVSPWEFRSTEPM